MLRRTTAAVFLGILGAMSFGDTPLARHRHDHTDGSADPNLLGVWTLLVEGKSCRITMSDVPWWGGWKAETRGCDQDFFLVNRWAGGGTEIQFTAPGDRVAGQMTRTAKNRYEGFRESDGAALVLTR
jgi:hypothetical protein